MERCSRWADIGTLTGGGKRLHGSTVSHLSRFSDSFVRWLVEGGLCSQRQIEPMLTCGRPLHTSRVGPVWLSSSVEPGAGSLLPLPNEPQEYSLEIMCPLQSPPFANKAPGATGQHVPVTSIQCDGEVREEMPQSSRPPRVTLSRDKSHLSSGLGKK